MLLALPDTEYGSSKSLPSSWSHMALDATRALGETDDGIDRYAIMIGG